MKFLFLVFGFTLLFGCSNHDESSVTIHEASGSGEVDSYDQSDIDQESQEHDNSSESNSGNNSEEVSSDNDDDLNPENSSSSDEQAQETEVVNYEDIRLSWVAPTEYVNSTKIEDLEIDSYLIYWGHTQENMTNIIEVKNNSGNFYVFEDMPTGQYYFSIKVKSVYNEISDISNIVAKIIP